MSHLLIVGPVALGLMLLILSIWPIFHILSITRKGKVRFGWLTLTALLVVFIPGYAGFAWLETSAPVEPSDFVVAGLLFLGACFVLSVAILSRQTAEDILRIAALEQNAFTDDLTGLFNRRYLSLRAPNELARALRYGVELSLIMIDIDRFKRVNDRYGHLVGDEVLRAVAATIAQDIRVSDIAVRYGGEELLVLATGTDIDGALCLAERLRVKIGALPHLIAPGEEVHISVSIGVAALRESDTIDALLKRADDALYRAKRGGRNRVCEEEAVASGVLGEEDFVTPPMPLTVANFGTNRTDGHHTLKVTLAAIRSKATAIRPHDDLAVSAELTRRRRVR